MAELRRSAIRRVAGLAAEFEGIVDASTDVATDDEHDPEGHTIAWERQQIAAFVERAETSIAEIDAAQQRIDEGRYGVCAGCDCLIPAERLEVLPTTPHCVRCATRAG